MKKLFFIAAAFITFSAFTVIIPGLSMTRIPNLASQLLTSEFPMYLARLTILM
jgi:hypothetical protein